MERLDVTEGNTVELDKVLLIAEGDKVACRYTVTGGTNQTEFPSASISRIADGKIVEYWWAYDGLELILVDTAVEATSWGQIKSQF